MVGRENSGGLSGVGEAGKDSGGGSRRGSTGGREAGLQ